MNPQAEDTVTSTKLTSSTTTSTTKTIKTTTGSRIDRPALRPETKAATRKRRQPEQSTKARPEVNVPPPVKSRRQTQTLYTGKSSCIGDFFSSITSHIHGPDSLPTMQDNHEKSKNLRVECDKNMVQTIENKQQGDGLTQYASGDSNKKRKIELDECAGEGNNALAENLNEKDRILTKTSKLIKIDSCKNAGTNKCKSEIASNDNSAKKDKSAVNVEIEKSENETAIKSDKDQTANQIKKPEESGNRIISMCKSFLGIIIEKPHTAEESKESASSSKSKNQVEKIKAESIANQLGNCPAITLKEQINTSPECQMKAVKPSVNAPVDEDKDPTESFDVTSSSSRYSLHFTSATHSPRRDETVRMRKTIQWLEEGARRMREELATVRSELHEERRAAKVARREYEAAIRDAKNAEAVKYNGVISDLKIRLSQSPSRHSLDSISTNASKTDYLKDENHRREMVALRNRLAVAECTIQKLKTNCLDRAWSSKKNKAGENGKVADAEMRKLEAEVQSLRTANKKLEEKLHIAEESARTRAAELRIQHENHEAEQSAIQKALRSDTIKLLDEIQSKNRLIEKLDKLVSESAEANRKLRTKEDKTMRKLRESERSHQIRLAPRLEEKIHRDEHEEDICKVEYEEETVDRTELDRVRELAAEQQEVIEVLRQALKEKERKLEQLTNKRRKEEFYKQWLELEPVAEVDDEYEHEEGDSALSSAPSSLSPQPGVGRTCNNNHSGVTREAYESVLLEIEELQTRLQEEQQELVHVRCQFRELEKALLQETRGSQTSRRALSQQLREAEEREARLISEISDLREQNEVLEFRVLELEESPNLRDTPDPADSGIVSPEPIQLYKEHQANKHRDRAVATVIPYTSTYSEPVLPSDPQKAPLSLQESGIFEAEDVEEDEDVVNGHHIKLSSQFTQTEAPAGELLQEVQRLQDLRARIQERAAKVPPVSPISDRKNDASCEFAVDIVTPLRERIRELEEQLRALTTERQERKQREEELLDENYRLTEKTYCLEAQLKDLQNTMPIIKESNDAETMTEKLHEEPMPKYTVDAGLCQDMTDNNIQVEDSVVEGNSPMSRCQSLYKAAIQSLDENTIKTSFNVGSTSAAKDQPCQACSELWRECDARIHSLARTEFCLRQQITSLEHRESAFFETLRQADATWAKLEADYETKQKEMSERLSAQVELNRALFEHLTKLNKKTEKEEPMEVDVFEVDIQRKLELSRATQTEEVEGCRCQRTISLSRSSSTSTTSGVIVRADASRVSTISLTSIKMTPSEDCDEIDTNALTNCSMRKPAELPTEVATEAKEEDNALTQARSVEISQQDQPEALVSIDESSTDKSLEACEDRNAERLLKSKIRRTRSSKKMSMSRCCGLEKSWLGGSFISGPSK